MSNLQDFPVLETKRLRLREITDEDADAIFQYLSDEEVIRYLEGNTENIEEARGYVSWCRETCKSKTDIRWGIELKDQRKLIGDCGLGHIDDPHRPTELGYMLAKAYWNQGYMTEAVAAILQFGFKELNLHRVQAWTHHDNKASAQILRRQGFIHEGRLREYVFIWHQGVYIDAEMYGLLRNDYRGSVI